MSDTCYTCYWFRTEKMDGDMPLGDDGYCSHQKWNVNAIDEGCPCYETADWAKEEFDGN